MPGTSLAAVVPCYNAGFRVRPVVEGLAQQLEHVIVVDDGSTDGAVEALADTAARVVAFPENRGKGHAMLAGFRAALDIPSVTCVAIIDADGQHDPTELPRLFQAFREEEADLVIGSRVFDERNVPLRSRVGNKLTRTITHLLLGQEVPDTQSGYRLHSRRFLEEVLRVIPGGRYETEMEIVVLAVRGPYKVVPVPIQTIYETGNSSSHFGALRDSYRIYRSLFRAALGRRGSPS